MKELNVKLTFTDPILGSLPGNKEVFQSFVQAKAPVPDDAEVEAIDVEQEIAQGMTVFPKRDGKPFLYDYQIKGMFKNACQVLRRVDGTESAKIKAFKKEIDGLVFFKERENFYEFDGEMTTLERPLRAQTAQGERVSLAMSECIPEGATVSFTVQILADKLDPAVREWLDYGKYNGLGQWHNSGKGRFVWEEVG